MIRRDMYFGLILVGALLSAGCSSQNGEQVAAEASGESAGAETAAVSADAQMPGAHTGIVVETMDAASYTYVKVDTGSAEIWAAAPTFAVEVGQHVTVPPGMAMEAFHSDTLDRDFDLIYFVDHIGPAGEAAASGQFPEGHPQIGGGEAPEGVELAGIEVAENGLTVGDLYAKKGDLAGQRVSLRGKVVKVNLGIMGRNWIHLQDGSGDATASTNDLTVTTTDSASVGDTVLVAGTLTLDKDFGAGYRYAVIVEDAEITVE